MLRRRVPVALAAVGSAFRGGKGSAMIYPDALIAAASQLLAACRRQHIKIATAESCTGGLIAGLLTEIAGSSEVLERGFITYSNAAKVEMLGVSADLIARSGAVSEAVACAMAEGALLHAKAQLTVAVTGLAGPGGGAAGKPIGLVHLAAARTGRKTQSRELRLGDIGRDRVRMATVEAAVALLWAARTD
jgi:nicotinamide-nucleotide amidase